ncbi:LysR family transcriptional regulator [Buttiauxella agrestis]
MKNLRQEPALSKSKRLDLNSLLVFMEIYNTASIYDAAKKMGISTCSVSQNLNKMRLHFKYMLFIHHDQVFLATPLVKEVYTTLKDDLESLLGKLKDIG